MLEGTGAAITFHPFCVCGGNICTFTVTMRVELLYTELRVAFLNRDLIVFVWAAVFNFQSTEKLGRIRTKDESGLKPQIKSLIHR